MRRLVFIISLCVCFALSANGAGAENIARGVRVIVIDAGHGGPKFPGAHYRGIYEKDLNLKVALKLGALIERELPEVKVVYTRKTDKQFSESLTKDLQARADIANKAEGDLFFSIHTNAAPTAAARGVETLIMGESPLEQRINDEVLFANNKGGVHRHERPAHGGDRAGLYLQSAFHLWRVQRGDGAAVGEELQAGGAVRAQDQTPTAQSTLCDQHAGCADRNRFHVQSRRTALHVFRRRGRTRSPVRCSTP